jgi:zinc transport system permease protein
VTLLDSFIWRAAFAGVGVAVAAGPLGCFVVWRRMAYFGDATSHAALLGVALALATDLPMAAGVAFAALAMALTVSAASGRTYAMDTMLGVASHAALATGLVAVSFIAGVRIDLTAYLFGDILAVGRGDLVVIYGGAFAITALIAWRWDALLLSTLNADLAAAAGVDPRRERLMLTLALALLVAVAIKVVGVLLITAMLIIPAAAARAVARTPESMAGIAVGLGAVAALAGLAASWHLDTPTGPSIVMVAAALLVLANAAAAVAGARAQRAGEAPR